MNVWSAGSRHSFQGMSALSSSAECPSGLTQCLALIDEIQVTGEPVIITKHGKPVVKLVPAEPGDDRMSGKTKIVGEIVGPVTPIEDWEALGVTQPLTGSLA